MDVWVQGRLFEESFDAAARPSRGARRMDPARKLRVGGASVTRDLTLATSLAGDIRIGLARSLDRLSPELRRAIRAAVSSRRSSAAA